MDVKDHQHNCKWDNCIILQHCHFIKVVPVDVLCSLSPTCVALLQVCNVHNQQIHVKVPDYSLQACKLTVHFTPWPYRIDSFSYLSHPPWGECHAYSSVQHHAAINFHHPTQYEFLLLWHEEFVGLALQYYFQLGDQWSHQDLKNPSLICAQ